MSYAVFCKKPHLPMLIIFLFCSTSAPSHSKLALSQDTAIENLLLYRQYGTKLLSHDRKTLPCRLTVDQNGTGNLVHELPKLTFNTAKQLWGEPQHYKLSDFDFYTFDAHSVFGQEENIYHLDLRFDNSENLTKYRVRGIGIFNPKWVSVVAEPSPITKEG